MYIFKFPFKKIFRGFSLVELLVVIGLLGVISTVGIILINPKTQFNKANDSTRKNDLKKIQTVLELYRSNNDYYPPVESYPLLSQYLVSGSVKYLNSLPLDPNPSSSYAYHGDPFGCDNVSTFCSRYYLWACLQTNDTQADANRNPSEEERCTSPLKSYTVKNP